MKLPPITPGPWTVAPQRTSLSVRAVEGPTIATIRSSYDPTNDADRKGADARAIAQVPAMLEALVEAAKTFRFYEAEHRKKGDEQVRLARNSADQRDPEPYGRAHYEKADRNREKAETIEAVLRAAGCELEESSK